ncbi:MAG: metallophosphoesterase family protein [Caryophanon sp.]|nr:metallophosphoesterase family protein [Caryophanon sp.]
MWKKIIGATVLTGASIVAYMFKVAHENTMKTHMLRLRGQREQLRIFFISDVHARRIDDALLEKMRRVDVIIIGGDFCDERVTLAEVERNIQKLVQIAPTYFVWGNNDRELGEEALTALFERYGVHVLNNENVRLTNYNNPWVLAAINDTSKRDYNIDEAFKGTTDDDFVIYISHNPQVFARTVPTYKPVLMLGGHLHGGQIRFGRFGMHENGAFVKKATHAELISNGYGTTLVPLRLGAHPEAHIIDIHVE